MKPEQFIGIIKDQIRDAGINETIEFIKKPPGRKPRKKHVELSEWFNSLTDKDRSNVMKMMEEAVDASLFGLFCTLDGVRSVGEQTFELYVVENGDKKLLNDQNEEALHDIYNSMTNPID
ncbi:hypothetical protein KZ483_04925 [Paenibacillus sp. sptzw28]|uniref:hypothetical protein n=1 Tax=Paenibacillus sp. sptzw28 TaxID=715179 RepID=UPI001C6EB456|nr:hypothetical protein [Paenibacillus sp. sptzw28]QYR22336.1 hypothetical protein KZ483_04925 [Paenibacillus sp. sptzw28]